MMLGQRGAGWAVSGVLFGLLVPTLAAAQAPATRRYAVGVESKLKMTLVKNNTIMNVKASATFDYSLTPLAGGKVETRIDGIELVTQANDQPENKARMSRAGFSNSDGQETQEISRDKAPANLQATLDQFGTPIAVFSLDGEGKEVGQPEMKIKDGVLVDTNAYLTTRTFHARFPKNETRWTIATSLPLGKGQMAKGDLTFEKQPKALPDGSVMVKVTGDLKAEGMMGPAKINKGIYKLRGSQIYSPQVGDWTSGRYDIQMELDADDPRIGQLLGTGPVTLTLKMLK